MRVWRGERRRSTSVPGIGSGSDASLMARELLSLHDKMPLWMNILVCFSKPIVLTKIFGVPKTDKEAPASCIKVYLIAPFFVLLTAVAWLSDISTIVDIIGANALNETQRALSMLFAASVSSNLQTALAFGTMLLNYMSANDGDMREAAHNMGRLQGWLWFIAMSVTTLVYLPVLVVILMFVLPGLGFYAWLAVPFLAAAWAYWKYLQREISNADSPLAGLMGTRQGLATGVLGPLADVATTCPGGHILLPAHANNFRPGWGCDGLRGDRGGGAERRMEKLHVCARQTVHGSEVCFTCVVCDCDLCQTCYAEERAFQAQQKTSEHRELEVEKVVQAWKDNAVKTGEAYTNAAAILKIEIAKQWALTLIPLVPVLGSLVPMLVPVVLRFYMGEGCVNAVVSTWSDRNVHAFVKSLTDTSIKQLRNGRRFMHFVGTGQFDPLLQLLLRWIQTLNYLI